MLANVVVYALLQKSFTQDYLTKKQKINEGEVPQYYVTGSHPAIIKPDEWDLVQLEINNRKRSGGHYTSKIFNGKIICGDCGSSYGAKVWHSNDPYRTVIWQCNDKFKGKKCGTRHLQEEQIKELFIQAYSKFVTDRTQIISDLNMLIDSCLDTASLESKVEQIITDLELLYSAMKQCVSDNASALISEADYKGKYSELYERYEKFSSEKAKLEEKITTTKQEAAKLKDIILTLETAEQIPMVYDNTLFNSVIDKVVVKHDDTITFCFVGGKEYYFDI